MPRWAAPCRPRVCEDGATIISADNGAFLRKWTREGARHGHKHSEFNVNEEEVKIQRVLPWLQRAGVELSELQLERSFSVRVGRHTFQTTRDRASATGRLDILVRRGDKNLLVVETKAEHLELDDDDRDQAISYARLVHPLAPYVVVTNGNDYRLYETLTKQRVEPSTIRFGNFEATLPDEAVLEAQKIFFGLNPSNLAIFCQSQVAGELRLVKGTIAEGKKYVPELHLPRSDFRRHVNELYQSAAPGLLVVGESGTGKTSELCSLVHDLTQAGQPVLFFNGFSLAGDLLSAIATEFSWTFGGQDSPVQVIKRLETCSGRTPLTIVVDGIDEWRLESKVAHLGALLSAGEHRNIKFILSCKVSALNPFVTQRGNPTALKLLSRRADLQPFTAPEFFRALERYRQVYQFFGGFEDAVLQQAQANPFLLRVLFDVAQTTRTKHLTFTSSEFFEAYYERAIARTADRRRAEETLKSIARTLYTSRQETAEEDSLRAALSLSVNDNLMEELFEYNILIRSAERAGEASIGFYFQQFRDYIICFQALRFPRMSQEELLAELHEATGSGIRLGVMRLYYRLATPEHKTVFDGPLRPNATSYLQRYRSLLERDFPALRSRFEPHGTGPIGWVGELTFPQLQVDVHGFRQLGESDEEIHFVPVEPRAERSNLSYLAGAALLHGSSSNPGFRGSFDIDNEVRRNEVIRQLRELVNRGRLNESANPEMLVEQVIHAIEHHARVFSPMLDGRKVRYPVQLNSIAECLRREKLARHFRDEVIRRKRESGAIVESWNGTTVSFSADLTAAEEQEVQNEVQQCMSTGAAPAIRARHVELEKLESVLSDARQGLQQLGATIPSPRLNFSLFELNSTNGIPEREILQTRLGELYAAFLRNYTQVVQTNFPTLTSSFSLYAKLPVALFLVLDGTLDPLRGQGRLALVSYVARAKGNKNTVEVVDAVEFRRSGGSLSFAVAGETYEGLEWTRTVLSNGSIGYGLDYASFCGMPLRRMVYARIQQELRAVEAAFLKGRTDLIDSPCDKG